MEAFEHWNSIVYYGLIGFAIIFVIAIACRAKVWIREIKKYKDDTDNDDDYTLGSF